MRSRRGPKASALSEQLEADLRRGKWLVVPRALRGEDFAALPPEIPIGLFNHRNPPLNAAICTDGRVLVRI
jgi:hypothetical protein